jgi:hypothetical protein
MGRLVRKPQAPSLDLQIAGLESMLQSGIGGMPAAAAGIAGDNYLERVVKYVPAEVIAFFMVINAILDQAMKTGGKTAMMAGFPVTGIAAGALVLACVLTPMFCWYVREPGDAWITNAFVSTLAFPFWAYLMGAVAFADYRDGNLAVILVLTFTVVSGLISPRARRPKRRAERQDGNAKDGPRLVEAMPA